MNKVTIKTILSEGAKLPEYKTSGAAGCDVHACLKEDFILRPGYAKAIPTGLKVEIPEGYEIQIRPRSGLALKNSVTVLNTPGTIDSDYRGEISVILMNFSGNDFVIHNGDRIAQIVVAPVTIGEFEVVDSISSTERGEGGFGHSGV